MRNRVLKIEDEPGDEPGDEFNDDGAGEQDGDSPAE